MEKEKGLSGETVDSQEGPPAPEPESEVLRRELEAGRRTIAGLEQELAGRDTEVASLRQALASAEERLAGVNGDLAQAVASYKSLVIEANPGVLAEMVNGATVAEVDQSLGYARALVEKVKQEMETEIAKARVPLGAPPRAPLDLSALSSREKIQYAIGGKR